MKGAEQLFMRSPRSQRKVDCQQLERVDRTFFMMFNHAMNVVTHSSMRPLTHTRGHCTPEKNKPNRCTIFVQMRFKGEGVRQQPGQALCMSRYFCNRRELGSVIVTWGARRNVVECRRIHCAHRAAYVLVRLITPCCASRPQKLT